MLHVDCIRDTNNAQIDQAKDIDIDMPMYNLIEYSKSYSKASGILWQYYRDKPALTNAGDVANFHAANNTVLVKFKQKIIGKTPDGGTKNVEIMVPLKYFSNFWKTLEIALISCEINLILTSSNKCGLSNDARATTFAIIDTSFDQFINMTEKDVNQEFRSRKIKKKNNYFIKVIDQIELLSNKNKKVCTTLNYIEHFLTLAFAVTVCISISAFASLVYISMRTMSYTIGVSICAITARIKKYESIIKKKKKKHN